MEVTLRLMPFLNLKFKITNLKFTKGFSLVEILVVVAILGILAGVVSYTLVGHQKKARDAQRKSDLAQVKRALQAAKNDCKSAAYYPDPFRTVFNGLTNSGANEKSAFSSKSPEGLELESGLMGYLPVPSLKYLNSIVTDPKNSGNYWYKYAPQITPPSGIQAVCPNTSGAMTIAGAENFILRTVLEDTFDPSLKTSWAKCSPKIYNATSNPTGPIALGPSGGVDSNSDGIDDLFYYYECND